MKEQATQPDLNEGETIGPGLGLIEVHVDHVNRLFNALDPSPFRERDLDPKAEEFIVESGGEFGADQPLALIVHLDQRNCTPDEVRVLRDAVHGYFTERARATRNQLRALFRVGRKSLLISLLFLSLITLFRDLLGGLNPKEGYWIVLKEGLVIVGWVALWRPLEIFLYDWWPIRAKAKLYDRLAIMPVRVLSSQPPPVN